MDAVNKTKADIYVAQSIGQLGNRLVQFAHLIAFSEKTGCRIYNPSFYLYSKYFKGTSGSLCCKYPRTNSQNSSSLTQKMIYYLLRVIGGLGLPKIFSNFEYLDIHWTAGDYDLGNPHFLEIVRKKRGVFLLGSYKHRFFQGFAETGDQIRDFFRLVPEIEDRVERHMLNVRKSVDIVVGLHIRQGDNFTDPGRCDAFSSQEYAFLAEEAQNLFGEQNVAFLICSNAKQNPDFFKNLNVFHGPGDFVEDMYSLAKCDYLIGPGESSFSEWASFIGGKPRYAVKNPLKKMELSDFKIVKVVGK